MSRDMDREAVAYNARKILANQEIDAEVRLSTEKTKGIVLWVFAVGRHVGTVFISQTGSMMTYRAAKIAKTFTVETSAAATLGDALRFAVTDRQGKLHGVPA